MEENRSFVILTLLWLVLAAIFIRLWGLGAYYWSPDEADILKIASAENISQVWRETLLEQHPPFHLFLIHYLQKISPNIFFLKASSLIPGVFLILNFFLLGRLVSGRAAGLFMAYIAAFGHGGILMSQVIRSYSLLALLLSLALWFYFSFSINRVKWHVYGYVLCMMSALSIHYSTVIPLSGISAVWLCKMLLQKRPVKDFLFWFVLHLPLMLMAAAFYFFHLSKISKMYQSCVAGYLSEGMPGSFHELICNVYSLFDYFFYQPVSFMFVGLSLLGAYALWKTLRWEATVITALTLIIGMVLSVLKLYPLSASRQDFFMFPFIALLCSAAIQYLVRVASDILRKRYQWFTINRVSIDRVVLGLVIISTVPLMLHYSRYDFLRRFAMAGSVEFPVRKVIYKKAFEFLIQNLRPDDIILTTQQTANYLILEAGRENVHHFSDTFSRVRHRNLDYYYIEDLWYFESNEQFQSLLRQVSEEVSIKEDGSVWIYNIGYYSIWLDNAALNLFSKQIVYGRLVKKSEAEYLMIYIIPGRAALWVLDEN